MRTSGPGRPQVFCSEICRRAYEKELRQARARLAHFEEVVAKCRADLDTFRFDRDDLEQQTSGPDAQDEALAAVHRVSGVLAFLDDSQEPLARELQNLHAAVAPIVLSRPN